MKKAYSIIAYLAISCGLTGCGNWNIKGGTSGSSQEESGIIIDNDTGDKIRQEVDEDGNLRDCTIGKSSERTDLPSCNDIVNRREADSQDKNLQSQELLRNELSGSQLVILKNGNKVLLKTAAKYNDESSNGGNGGDLIINATIQRVKISTQDFEDLFISKNSSLEISFVDQDDFAMLKPLLLPLNIQAGQAQNINYRKKMNTKTNEVKAVMLQARLPLASIREYRQIAKLDIAFKAN